MQASPSSRFFFQLSLFLSFFASAAQAGHPFAPVELQACAPLTADERPNPIAGKMTLLPGMLRCPKTEAWVKQVFDRLVEAGGLANEIAAEGGIELLVFCNVDEVNAALMLGPDEARRGSQMLVAGGLISQVDAEDELAMVLGHELSHYVYCHHRSSQANELAADDLGLELMTRAGYKPTAAVRMFKHLRWSLSGPFARIIGVRDLVGYAVESLLIPANKKDHPSTVYRSYRSLQEIKKGGLPYFKNAVGKRLSRPEELREAQAELSKLPPWKPELAPSPSPSASPSPVK